MRKSPVFDKPLICERCEKSVVRTAPMQRYCRECSEEKSKERARLWARVNPSPKPVHQRAVTKRIQKEVDNGLDNSITTKPFVSGRESDRLDFMHVLIVKIPFSYGYSKNAIYTLNTRSRGHVHMREEARSLRTYLSTRIKNSINLNGMKFYQAKVYLDIHVEKPDHRGDAVNVIDSVCDGVKDAIGVDDRWFSIRNLDWDIVKTDPQITVGIYQAATEDYKVCHRCGRIFPLSELPRGRVCMDCRKPRKK